MFHDNIEDSQLNGEPLTDPLGSDGQELGSAFAGDDLLGQVPFFQEVGQ
jgi:hypothetical protein